MLFVLPAVCVAMSQARLSPIGGSAARVVAATAVASAWGSQHPAAVTVAIGGGRRPWLRLSVIEALAALLLAVAGATLLRGLHHAGLRLLHRALARSPPCHSAFAGPLACLAVLGSSWMHPAAPAYVGWCWLAVGLHRAQRPGMALGWLAFYSQLALLPSVALFAWLASGAPRDAAARSDGRILVAALALHACWLARRVARAQADDQPRARLAVVAALEAAVHEAAACASATSSLWGHPYVALYSAACSATAQLLLGPP